MTTGVQEALTHEALKQHAAPAPVSPSELAPPSQVATPPTAVSGTLGVVVNNYLNSYINIADSKATAFVAGNLVALGVVMSQNDPSRPNAPFHLLAIGCFIVAAAISMLVLFPRLPEGGSGTIFWEDIRSYKSPQEYHAAVARMDLHNIEEAYAVQNYHVAHVLHTKHKYLRWAIIASAVGIACAVINYWLR